MQTHYYCSQTDRINHVAITATGVTWNHGPKEVRWAWIEELALQWKSPQEVAFLAWAAPLREIVTT